MKSKLIFIALVLACNGATAQGRGDESSFNNLYIYAEYGQTKGYQHLFQGGAYLQAEGFYFKVKSVSAFDYNTDAEKQLYKAYYYDGGPPQENVGFQDVSFMVGKGFRSPKHHQIQFGAGLSAFFKTDKDEAFNNQKQAYQPDRYKTRFTVGLPAELRYSFQFGRAFAFSVTGTGNANFLKSYVAVSAGVAFGMF
ncbi:hypothetical protein VRU48_09615 [Pedobacter sp. KR3-3]|uniref:Outer membrane protein beta-barrel domain-containing protein n=1 Tax=Pedobacter albus TaxID=3113905 RepID=A0ABU7I7P0_9SPHI|nr:hypothetical protein [Pedobacter sp. KR3-3]MEE1945366.1 hypothetical protein [Pedobacter sp. KR3-3]